MSTFKVPPGSRPGGFVFAPLPTANYGGGDQFTQPYGNGGYQGAYNQGAYNQVKNEETGGDSVFHINYI
jgi:hypothetical protein